jgi:hypothetical protein
MTYNISDNAIFSCKEGIDKQDLILPEDEYHLEIMNVITPILGGDAIVEAENMDLPN